MYNMLFILDFLNIICPKKGYIVCWVLEIQLKKTGRPKMILALKTNKLSNKFH